MLGRPARDVFRHFLSCRAFRVFRPGVDALSLTLDEAWISALWHVVDTKAGKVCPLVNISLTCAL